MNMDNRRKTEKGFEICSKCERGFSVGEITLNGMCVDCERNLRADLQVLLIFKWICYSAAIVAFIIFIPILLAREVSPGYYQIPSSRSRASSGYYSKNGLMILTIVAGVAGLVFGSLGLWLGMKHSNKKSGEPDSGLSIQ